mmetsp:Transcript_2126/g.4423  ORF Transcript_2126/g.4423 Transcript_2126/m.4423 type:complete len:245 (-) Transcript_2126:372-1106(-)
MRFALVVGGEAVPGAPLEHALPHLDEVEVELGLEGRLAGSRPLAPGGQDRVERLREEHAAGGVVGPVARLAQELGSGHVACDRGGEEARGRRGSAFAVQGPCLGLELLCNRRHERRVVGMRCLDARVLCTGRQRPDDFAQGLPLPGDDHRGGAVDRGHRHLLLPHLAYGGGGERLGGLERDHGAARHGVFHEERTLADESHGDGHREDAGGDGGDELPERVADDSEGLAALKLPKPVEGVLDGK